MISGDVSNSRIAHVIDEYIHSERDRKILKSRLIDDLFFEKLAEMYQLSVRHVKTIVYKGQEIVFKHLND